jgi:tetratricopeptide (TPR) repeat protein
MRFAVLLVAVALTLSPLARADEPGDSQEAKRHWEKGTALYDMGHYLDAAREYEESFKLKPSVAALLFNIAQAYRLGGDHAAALRAYRGYLRRDPQAANRGEVEAYITKCELALQTRPAAPSPASPRVEPLAPRPSPPSPSPSVSRSSLSPSSSPSLPAASSPSSSRALAVGSVTAAPARRTPGYKKWWVWTLVGGVVAAGVGAGLGVALTRPKDIAIPAGAHMVQF